MGGEGSFVIFASIEAGFIKMSEVCGTKGSFMGPSIVIGAGGCRVDVYFLYVTMFEGLKVANCFSLRKGAEDISNSCS